MKTNLAEPITLCLINYNGLAHLQKAITVLYSLQTRSDEILVVENASLLVFELMQLIGVGIHRRRVLTFCCEAV